MSVSILNELRRNAYIIPNLATEEIEVYLADPVAQTSFDIVDWWCRNSKRFTKLSTMVKDYLSQQSMSIASERIFSRACATFTKKRNRMSAITLKHCLCVNSWVVNILNLREEYFM
ncbi:unnamed protein product [Gordionus sp. m RMFG-2023]